MLDKLSELVVAKKVAQTKWRIEEQLRYQNLLKSFDEDIIKAINDARGQGNSIESIAKAMGYRTRASVYQYLKGHMPSDLKRVSGKFVQGDFAQIDGHKFERIDGVWQPEEFNPTTIALLEQLT